MGTIAHLPGRVNAERVMTDAQRRRLFAAARQAGLDPMGPELAQAVARTVPGAVLENLGGDRELDAVLAALPRLAAELRARADTALEPLALFQQVRDRRDYDGGWGNAVASYRCRAANVLRTAPPLRDFMAWAVRCVDIPPDFRAELARQVGLEEVPA